VKKSDIRAIKKQVLRCLTTDIKYGTTKNGEPRKYQYTSMAIFNKNGPAIWNDVDLEMVMDKIVLALYFTWDDSEEKEDN